ncbi:MAG: ABC transporter permease [Candidatus Hydrogenedentes bacterium]|jgi:putative ABC transport system permease protein|nr:ABC transporter permease [Candidatus Hydrogenedentota bacterium]
MSLWHIAWSYLWSRKLTTGLTILSVALAVGLISAVLTIRDETNRRFVDETNAYELVVGPAGSPLQLVLSSVYFLDQAVGSMKYSLVEQIRGAEFEDAVENVFPVALGDVYRGFRIVGTERDLFDFPWKTPRGEVRNPFQLRGDGKFFDGPMQAVVGYLAARRTGLKVGETFVGLHGSSAEGLDHSETPYTVVGVLEASGTSNDRAIFVSLDSIWASHADYDEGDGPDEDEELEVSAILVDARGGAVFTLRRDLPEVMLVQAVRPIDEIRKLFDQFLGPAIAILKAIGYVVVVISAITILIGLYLSIIQRKRDLAIMRALGASAAEIFGAVMIEAFLVTILGILSGWALGKVTAMTLGVYMGRVYGFSITGTSTGPDELYFFSIVAGIGLLAGIVPAWQAYQTDVAKDLSAM